MKKGVLNNFVKFTGKHLCWSLFFNEVAEFCENFKNTFFTGHIRATVSGVILTINTTMESIISNKLKSFSYVFKELATGGVL